ncbi:MAG: ABC transporter substrate-binding protein, partial [Bdellovibrionales bacterium]|nr:ABC transporter substrate-binding protein [Bdellovibrionales bacterium]
MAHLIIILIALWGKVLLGNDIILGISSVPNNLSPFYSTDANSQNINRILHKSLVDLDRDMNFICILCETYKEIKSKDGYKIYFKLKKGLQFWDGTNVNAKSVQKSVEHFKNENIKSVFRFAFGKIKSVVELSEYEFEIIYDRFELDHLSNLVLLKIIKLNDGLESLQGIGEYRLEMSNDLTIMLKSKTKPNFIFKVVRDETTMALKLINNEIDISIGSISPRKTNWILKKYPEINKWESESSNYVYLNPNHQSKILNDINMRKALSLLVPRKDILKYKLKDTAIMAHSIFSKSFKDVYIGFDIDSYDKKRAMELIGKSGYKLKDKFLYKDGKRLELNWIVSNNKRTLEIVNVIKNSFEDAHIKINLNVLEWGNFMRRYKQGQFDLVMAQWVGFTGPDILKFVFHSDMISPKGG